MSDDGLIPHLFRTEYRKIVSVLIRRFGFEQIEAAEDIASDTFLTAAQTWSMHGVPPNPTAWLYTVAKNKAKNALHRKALFERSVVPELQQEAVPGSGDPVDLSPGNITDSQLRMMFAVCHPSISVESQIGLALRILCGFGIEEIADAFLTSKDVINKRLFRAKETLRQRQVPMEFPGDAELPRRCDAVLRTIYLLFNEGYYSGGGDTTLRRDLCDEAMRLCTMLTEDERTDTPAANALLALMCFHASRFDARVDSKGEMVLYEEQDTTLWDTALIDRGAMYLRRAATGDELTAYHLEAGIASWHTRKEDSPEKWENILQLYDRLVRLHPTPMAALNRLYAVSKVHGKKRAIAEAEQLPAREDRFYHVLLGDLYTGIDNEKAHRHFTQALGLARSAAERRSVQKKIDANQ